MTCKPYDIPKTLVWEAWLHVKANQGAAGIDAETIERFEEKLGDNLYRIWNRMSSGSYFPPPVKAVPIPKKSGGVRILGIPTVADRIAQTAVKMWLEPRLDPGPSSCGETGVSWPSHCRSTPGLNQLQARLSALMPYRVAADVMQHLLPIDAGTSPETLRSHTLQVGERLSDAAAEKPPAAAPAITISLNSTFIRSREDGERHLEVRVGNVEAVDGGRQVFGAQGRDRHHRADPGDPGNRGSD